MAALKLLLVLTLIGLAAAAFIHDGHPYFEVSDLQAGMLHHEHIVLYLVLTAVLILLWPPRSGLSQAIFEFTLMVLILMSAALAYYALF